MPDLATLSAGSILASLVIYALTGGADFGGGVWDLLARGPRGPSQRLLVARAIGPIWETNHIWLVVAVVVLYTAFPRAFSVVSTALFVPLTLMLAGIVLRGGAFAIHSHEFRSADDHGHWGTVFASASLVTPVILGILAGAISSGGIRSSGPLSLAPPSVWLAPFPVAAGFFTLSLFSYLAAVYLIFETDDPLLREDFRTRAIRSAGAVALLAVVVALLAGREAGGFLEGLLDGAWSVPVLILAGASALGAYTALHLRSYQLARACAAAQTALVILGWGLAQYPYLVRPDVIVASSASPPATLRFLLVVLAIGAVALFPCILVLFRAFKWTALFGTHPKRP